MMAASVVRFSSSGKSKDALLPNSTSPKRSHLQFPADSNVALQTTLCTSPNNISIINKYNCKSEKKMKENNISLLHAGKKTAVTQSPVPAVNQVDESKPLSDLNQDSTDIALSQLQELDIAIAVRKVTKVDGRKTRWIHSRMKKLAAKIDSEKRKGKNLKNDKRAKSKNNIKLSSDINNGVDQANLLSDSTLKGTYIEKNLDDNCNNIQKNNNQIIMKEESLISNANSGHTDVLETMKMQFLQGTINIPELRNDKDKLNKKTLKLINGFNTNDSSNENKRKKGRPKRLNVKNEGEIKISQSTSERSTNINTSSIIQPENEEILCANNGNVKLEPKPELFNSTGGEMCPRRNFLTKGLREVRKSESGSESTGSSPLKDNISVMSSPPLPVSPTPTFSVIKLENNLQNSQNDQENYEKIHSSTSDYKAIKSNKRIKRKLLKDLSKKENIDLSKPNGHTLSTLRNTSSDYSLNKEKPAERPLFVIKRKGKGRRGRSKIKGNSLPITKSTSTVVVDVHNTVNGEPQTVLPVRNSVVMNKKSPTKPNRLHLSNSDSGNKDETLIECNKPIKKHNEHIIAVPETTNTLASPTSNIILDAYKSACNVTSSTNYTKLAGSYTQLKTDDIPENKVSDFDASAINSYTEKNVNNACVKENINDDFSSKPQEPVLANSKDLCNKLILSKKQKNIKDYMLKPEKDLFVNNMLQNDKIKFKVEPEGPSPSSKSKSTQNTESYKSFDITLADEASNTTTVNDSLHETCTTKPVDKVVATMPDSSLSGRRTNDPKVVFSMKRVLSPTRQKVKVPRILKQLFQDEGVQNMLRSVNESSSKPEGTSSNESSHKLRPKRSNESYISESPEPDESLIYCQPKRKKRGTEADHLFLDEGTLNLLTSIESPSRRPSLTEEQTDSTAVHIPILNKVSVDLESKCKGINVGSQSDLTSDNFLTKNVIENLKPQPLKQIFENPVSFASQKQTTEGILDKRKLKPGRPAVNVSIKNKSKGMLFQLRKDLQTLGIPSTDLSINQMQNILASHQPLVPPLKIKVNSNVPPSINSVTIKSVPRSECQNNNSILKNTSCDIEISRITTCQSTSSSASEIKTYGSVNSSSKQIILPKKIPPSAPNTPMTSLILPPEPNVGSIKPRIRGPSFVTADPGSIRQSQRSSVRQLDSFNFRDIVLRKFNNFTQIILSPSTTKMKNALNTRVLRELCEALSSLRRDETVKVVLLTSTGSSFCQGLDLTAFHHPNLDTRKRNAENVARAVKEFVRSLIQFPKMIVAGVNGVAMGLGVAMLPLFDMVFASDKAEFLLPYSKLGQVPEGGATFTFPNYYGKLQSTKMFWGHKLTASQAQSIGLVTETVWPSTFQEEVIPKVAALSAQPSQGMECTKALVNHHIITKLELSLESECRLLVQQWTSPGFLVSSKKFIETEELQMQKPASISL